MQRSAFPTVLACGIVLALSPGALGSTIQFDSNAVRTTVPEPSLGLLLALGVLGAARRRRPRRAR